MMMKERVSQIMDISGQQCFVNASYQNGRVVGDVSLLYSSRKMSFEFEPLSMFAKKQLLFIEIKRLYLEYSKRGDEGKYVVDLGVIRQDEMLKNDFNLMDTRMIFLGQIQGSPQKYIRINLRKVKKETTALEEVQIAEYKARTGYPPPVQFDTLEFTVVVSPIERLTLEVDLKQYRYLKQCPNDLFSPIPLKQVALEIQKSVVLVQDKENGGAYKLLYKSEIQSLTQAKALLPASHSSSIIANSVLIEENSSSKLKSI